MYTHYPSQGYSSSSVCIRWISKWLLCKMQMPAELDRTQQCYDLPWRVASCHIPLEKILTEIKSKTTDSVNKQGKRVFATRYCTLQTNF